MDELGFYIPFNSISVILRRWKGKHERLCAMKRRLGLGRISPPAGFKPVIRSLERLSLGHMEASLYIEIDPQPLQTMWAGAQQNCLCAQQRLRSAASTQSDVTYVLHPLSLMCALW